MDESNNTYKDDDNKFKESIKNLEYIKDDNI